MTTETPQQQAIYAQLTTIFHDVFDDDSLVLTPDLTAASVPEWDSFNHINLIVAVESRMKIKFQTAELESMNTVGHLVELIEKKLARKVNGV
jgi:acyl carrier protein